jgi:flagellar motor protein MotB
MSLLWFIGWLGCPKPNPVNGTELEQLDREVMALQDHLRQCETKLQQCGNDGGGAPNNLYPDLKQVFQGSEVQVGRQGVATVLTVRTSLLFSDPYQLKFRSEAEQILDLIGTAIRGNPDMLVMIVGHTSDRPLPRYWSKIYTSQVDWSARTAGALADRFVADFNCGAAQFVVAGRGPHSPRESNDLESGRDANQRLELWIYPPSVAPPNPG